jgi:hypothetical protein
LYSGIIVVIVGTEIAAWILKSLKSMSRLGGEKKLFEQNFVFHFKPDKACQFFYIKLSIMFRKSRQKLSFLKSTDFSVK